MLVTAGIDGIDLDSVGFGCRVEGMSALAADIQTKHGVMLCVLN